MSVDWSPLTPEEQRSLSEMKGSATFKLFERAIRAEYKKRADALIIIEPQLLLQAQGLLQGLNLAIKTIEANTYYGDMLRDQEAKESRPTPLTRAPKKTT